MVIAQADGGRMEGWLYLIRCNRFGRPYSRKRYFILQHSCLMTFKAAPLSPSEEPVRRELIDSRLRVTDNGRVSFHRKVFFLFTLSNTSKPNHQLKLGATSPEDVARWIHSFNEAALKQECIIPTKNLVAHSKRRWLPFRLSSKGISHNNSIDMSRTSSRHLETVAADVIAPSPWKIFGCQNGLRFFKEAKDWDFGGRHWGGNPAIMVVGTVDGTSEAIFSTLMSLGPSRAEWDFCFFRGSVIDHIDGHTEIIHKQLYSDWLPWGMKRRDLLLQRYWRRENDGTYVILYHSVFHKKCPPQKGFVRACIKSGGYVITPINQGKQSIVKHMLAIDWKLWKSYVWQPSARSVTIHMLERVSALRELFRTKEGNYSSRKLSMDLTKDNGKPLCQNVDINTEVQITECGQTVEENLVDEVKRLPSPAASFMELNDAVEEFFDVPEPEEDESYSDPMEKYQTKSSSTPNFVKKLHELAVHKKAYGTTLPEDPTCELDSSWTTADPSTFLIRTENYLGSQDKAKAKHTLMHMVGADWLRSDKREDDLGGRPGGIVQKFAENGGPEFFLIVNMQIPGKSSYSLALYYMTETPLEETPLLERFVNGDDAFRNSRFKLIPCVSKGAWIVKQSVRKKACLIGQALKVNYYCGKNYLELGIDIGSSAVARGLASFVLGYLNNVVMELAFLIQANAQEELPEVLLGTCRLNHLDSSKSVLANF